MFVQIPVHLSNEIPNLLPEVILNTWTNWESLEKTLPNYGSKYPETNKISCSFKTFLELRNNMSSKKNSKYNALWQPLLFFFLKFPFIPGFIFNFPTDIISNLP